MSATVMLPIDVTRAVYARWVPTVVPTFRRYERRRIPARWRRGMQAGIDA